MRWSNLSLRHKNKSAIIRIRHLFLRRWKWAKVIPQYLYFRYIRKVKVAHPPVFITGCGHSGTSILLAILGSHSNIYAVPDESNLGNSSYARTLMNCFNKLAISEGKNRWIEKTPQHIQCIDKLLELSPKAKIIIVMRDGRDAACSMQDRGGDISYGIKRWVNDNLAGEAYWGNKNVHVMKYEDLISNSETTIKDILHFIEEAFDKSLLEYYKSPKFYYSSKIKEPPNHSNEYQAQLRNWQINQPLFDGRGKWKRMNKDEKDLVKSLAGELLIKYGYVDSNDW